MSDFFLEHPVHIATKYSTTIRTPSVVIICTEYTYLTHVLYELKFKIINKK